MPEASPRQLRALLASFALASVLTAALAVFHGRIIILDAVLSYFTLGLIVARLLGRRQAASIALLAPVGLVVLVLTGVVRTDISAAGALIRAGALAAFTIGALYAMPRWLTRARDYRTASEQLRRQTAMLSAVVGSSPLAIIALDAETNVRQWNDAAERMLGWSAADVVGRPLPSVPPERVDEARRWMRAVLAGETMDQREAACVRKDGVLIDVSISAAPLYNAQGRIDGVVGLIEDITGRLQAHRALQSSEERLSGIVQSALDAVITIDEAGMITGWNPQAAETFGWSAEEAIGLRLSETIVPPEQRRAHEEGLGRFVADGGGTIINRRVQMTAQRRDGAQIPVELSVTAERTTEGFVFNAFVRDITDSARADARMAERALQLRLLAEASVELNRAVEFDEAMLVIAERARDLIGAHQAVLHASRDGGWANVTTAQSLSEKHGGGQSIHTQPDGSADYALNLKDRLPMRMTQAELQAHHAWSDLCRRPSTHPPLRGLVSAPLVARDGGHLGMIHLSDKYVGDFTSDDEALLVQLAHLASAKVENLRLLKAEHDQRAFRELIMESTTSGIGAVSTEGRLTLVNRRLCELSGYTADELTGQPAAMLFDPEEIAAFRTWFVRVIIEGVPVSGYELTLLRKDGTSRRVRIHLGPLKENGAIVGAAGSMEDITETKRLQEHVLRAQKIEGLGRLAGGVAHDFSNLMTIIIGHIELDLMSPPAADVLKRDLEEVRETAQRAANLAQQLLAFSRRQVIEPHVFALDDLIRSADQVLRRIIGEGIRVEIACPPETGYVHVDRHQFELVLVNLALNARDAMPDGGILRIETSSATVEVADAAGDTDARSYAMIAISDTGTGMTDEVKEHLFEPFFTTKQPGHGTGLGLATCYGAIKQAGGEVWVESELGRGTTVRIYLPAAVDDGVAPQTTAPDGALPAGSEAILLAEDEPLVRRLASRVLTSLGYAVIEAANGDEAMSIAQDGARFDLLLTDVVMPGMGGQRLADAARALRPGLRVLYMSGYTDDAAVRRGLSDLAIDFLPKPFSPGVLAAKVRQVLDAPPRTG